MSEAAAEATATTEAATTEAAATTTEATTETTTASPERIEHVLDKYRADGRTEQEAESLQAKSYSELEGKFGSFTGAPEEYELGFSPEITEAGVEFDKDDPLVAQAVEFAKNSNMSQEGFSTMLNLYAESQLANAKALDDHKAEEFKGLGQDGEKRVNGISDWANANMDAEGVAGLLEATQTAGAVKAVEAIIAKTRSASVAAAEAVPAASVTESDVQAMQFEVDKHSGQRRTTVDPAFKKEYERKRDLLYGTGEHKVIVNG